MNKGALHYQILTEWSKLLKQGRAFIIDPPGENPFPGCIVYGRNYLPDNESNALVMMGEAGAEIWFARFKPQYDRCKFIEAWATPNEPPIDTLAKRQMLTRFMIRFGQLMHAAGHKVIGGQWSVWWPDLGTAMDFAPALPYLDYVGFHEYGYPSMAADQPGRKCLHYRQVRAEWVAGGVQNIPPFLITECGEDDGQKHGWKTFSKTEAVYLADLQWYANELAKDNYVLAFFVFTAGNQGWPDFDITESLGKAIASPTAFVPPVAPPPVSEGDRLATLLKTAFGTSFEDLRATLPRNTTVPWFGKRDLAQVSEIIIHHTAMTATLSWSQVAQGELAMHPTWPGIAYSIGVSPAGTVSLFADIDENRGATNDIPTNKIGVQVCCNGNYQSGIAIPAQTPTTAMLASLARLRATLESFLGRSLKVLGHKDIDDTLCPGDLLYPYVQAGFVQPPVDDALRTALLAAGDAHQSIQLNPQAALQAAMYRDGLLPVSGEFAVSLNGVNYVGQKAERISGGIERVYFCVSGLWSNVKSYDK